MYLKFSINTFVPSENYLYQPAINWSTKRPYLYLNPTIKAYKDELSAEVSHQLSINKITLPDVKNIITVFIFGISEDRYLDADSTNMVKATEDAIFTGIKEYDEYTIADDKFVVSNINIKMQVPSKEDEGIICHMFINNDNITETSPVGIAIGMLSKIENHIEYMEQYSLPFSWLMNN